MTYTYTLLLCIICVLSMHHRLGILERRKGGHPMKLTYFVSPYDLIDEENRTYDTLNPDTIIKRKIGHSVTVCMEGSTGHKLPTSSIITVNRSPTGKRYVWDKILFLCYLYFDFSHIATSICIFLPSPICLLALLRTLH